MLQSDQLQMEDDDILNYIFSESEEIRKAAANFIYFAAFAEETIVTVTNKEAQISEAVVQSFEKKQ